MYFNSIEYAIDNEIITISSIPGGQDSHQFIRRKNGEDETLSYGWNGKTFVIFPQILLLL